MENELFSLRIKSFQIEVLIFAIAGRESFGKSNKLLLMAVINVF
jgi:hypothetical protein